MSDITVECLKKITFSLLPLSEKVEIITRGRPTPTILVPSSRVSKTKKFLKNFNPDWYDKIKWLCGCETSNALFCFPCLLFGGDTVWTQNGFTNISKMKEKTGKHQNSRRHLANMISLSLLSQINLSDQLNEASEVLKSDKQVKEYREELTKVIDCLKFSAKFELSLRHEGNTMCNALENLLCRALKKHELVFGVTPESVQNELLVHMLELCRQEIVSEVLEVPYVALVCEDVSDVSEKMKAIVVFRYEHRGVIRERFWSFLDRKSVDRDGMSNCLLSEIHKFLKKDSNKLIAYTFNGPLRNEGPRIQSIYGNAHFIHGFSSDFDLTLRQITSSIKSARLFFAKLSSLDRFFRKSPTRLEMLYEYTDFSTQPFDSLDVCTVHRVKDNLIKCLEDLASFRITDKALEATVRFLTFLEDENFLFWLEIFNKISTHLKQLYQDIQSGDPSEVAMRVEEFCKSVCEVCNCVSLDPEESSKMVERQEISDCICDEIRERLSFTGHLSAAKLFEKKNFEKFCLELPRADIRETCRAYPDVEEEKLQVELKILYSLKKFRNLDPLNILNLLRNDSGFSETMKLLKILVTSPVISNESEECFLTVRKVKSLIKDSIMEERLTAFCMISFEEEMLSQIKNFNEKVVQKYCDSGDLESGLK